MNKYLKKVVVFFTVIAAMRADAVTTINNDDKYAYGANVGWINLQADTNNGVVIGESYCTGYAYGANIGWINFGSGPTNGISYSNDDGGDFGVNHDGQGSLRGFAYGANVGWINFESNGAVRLDLQTGVLDGYAYGANIGWISFSNSQAMVKTDKMDTGPDSDGDGIADHWELSVAGNLSTMDENSDLDNDGVADVMEYLADTNPDNSSDFLQVTDQRLVDAGPSIDLSWPTQPTRQYSVEYTDDLGDSESWTDSGLPKSLGDGVSSTGRVQAANGPIRTYRVKGHIPLQ